MAFHEMTGREESVSTTETGNSGVVVSKVVTDVAEPENPVAEAVRVVNWLVSMIPSVTAATVTCAEVCPDGIVTLAGSVASVRSEDDRDTISGAAVDPLLETVSVTVVCPPDSNIEAGDTDAVKLATVASEALKSTLTLLDPTVTVFTAR